MLCSSRCSFDEEKKKKKKKKKKKMNNFQNLRSIYIIMQEGEQVFVGCFMYGYSRASIWCNL